LERVNKMKCFAFWIGLIFTIPCDRLGAADPSLCFAFLRGGDVIVACDGLEDRITRQANIESFAVSDEHWALGVVTSKTTAHTPTAVYVADTATLADLKSGKLNEAAGTGKLVSTCGSLFWLMDSSRQRSGTRDLLSDDEVSMSPYNWFRCNSDRTVVAGMVKASGGGLVEGMPPRMESPLQRTLLFMRSTLARTAKQSRFQAIPIRFASFLLARWNAHLTTQSTLPMTLCL
jgi:hypothetical protein